MKTGVIYTVKRSTERRSMRQVVLESKAVCNMAKLFSRIMGEQVSALQSVKILNIQAAITSLLLLGGISPLVAALLLVWLGLAVYQYGSLT